jgi:hypothetical protein
MPQWPMHPPALAAGEGAGLMAGGVTAMAAHTVVDAAPDSRHSPTMNVVPVSARGFPRPVVSW